MHGADDGQIAGGIVVAQAGRGGDVARRGERDQQFQATVTVLDEGLGIGILSKETLDLLGEGGTDVLWKEDGIVGSGTQNA